MAQWIFVMIHQILLKSRANVSTTFSWSWYSVTRPVFSIFMNSLSRVTDVSTLKEAAKLPFQMRRNCPALPVISSSFYAYSPVYSVHVSIWFWVFRSSIVYTHSLVAESIGYVFMLWLCLWEIHHLSESQPFLPQNRDTRTPAWEVLSWCLDIVTLIIPLCFYSR